MALRKLVISNLVTRKVRAALTVGAVALAVSLVVAVTSGYKSAEAAIFKYINAYMGATDVTITHKEDFREGVSENVVAEIRQDPAVNIAFGRLESDTGLVDAAGKYISGRAAQLVGLDRPADVEVLQTPIEAGKWFDGDKPDEAVIDQAAAEILKLNVGGNLLLPSLSGNRNFKVVGICRKPGILAERSSWIYLPLKAVQEINNRPGQLSRVMIDLKTGADDQAFVQRLTTKLGDKAKHLKIRTARDTRKEMDKNLEGVNFLSFLGGFISLISAAFIIFATLSMGVTERQRSLAMLRAIGARRFQIGQLVVVEGFYLSTAGAIVGVPLGILWTAILVKWKADFFSAGLAINWFGAVMAIICAAVISLLAGLFPAWTASRVSPLEAMTPLAKKQSMRTPVICALIGIALVALDPLMIHFAPPGKRDLRFYFHFVVGLPALIIGMFMAAPVIVWFVERIFSVIAAAVLGIKPHLVRQQLSGSGVWRAAGTGSALAVGLAILIVLQTVGHSMLSGWRLPTRFPDIFIWTTNTGLTSQQWPMLEKIEGVKKGEVMPIMWAFPDLPPGWFEIVGAAVLPNTTMFLGVDPDKALDMMHLEFRAGTPEEAKAGLKKGRHLIITEEFRVLKGLSIGDKMPLMTKNGLRDFTVCGVVWSPGLDVMVSMFDVGRMFEQRTAASVFGSLEDAKSEFGKEKAYMFAANLELGVDKNELLKKVKSQLGELGWKAGDVRKIKSDIEKGFARILLLMTTVAFSAMAVAALGVTNTVMASVRSRQWQFGILRSIGVTRGQLMRLVLAEAVLLGIVGCALGLAAGFMMTINALGLSKFIIGYVVTLTPPWGMITLGVAIIMVVSVLASLWPAASVAKTEPLTLLQSGRAAV